LIEIFFDGLIFEQSFGLLNISKNVINLHILHSRLWVSCLEFTAP